MVLTDTQVLEGATTLGDPVGAVLKTDGATG